MGGKHGGTQSTQAEMFTRAGRRAMATALPRLSAAVGESWGMTVPVADVINSLLPVIPDDFLRARHGAQDCTNGCEIYHVDYDEITDCIDHDKLKHMMETCCCLHRDLVLHM